MEQLDAEKENRERRWAQTVLFLSLDLMLPFHELMGLPVGLSLDIRNCCRTFIRNNRKKFYPSNLYQKGVAASAIIKVFESEINEHAARQLQKWFETVYSQAPSDHRDLLLWECILEFVSRDEGRWRRLSLPIRIENDARRRFMSAMNSDRFEELRDELSDVRLTDWDLHLYAIYLWDEEDPEMRDGPKLILYPTCKTWRNYEFWRWLLPRLSTDEIEILHRRGLEFAASEKSLRFIEDLRSPFLFL